MPRHPLGLRPSKIVAVQLNYRSRLGGRNAPYAPSYVLKPPSSLSESGAAVERPLGCTDLTFEGEIAAIIGKTAYRVPRETALQHVAYYAAGLDFGVRDLQSADRGSNLRAKGIDGYTPVGPALIDANGAEPSGLRLRVWVNDHLVQDTDGDEMLFDVAYMVADLSRLMTLEPGDILLTGSPSGNGRVEAGDVLEVALGDTPRLRSRIAESDYDLASVGAQPTREDDQGRERRAAPARDEPLSTSTVDMLRTVSTGTLSSQLRLRGLNNTAIEGVYPLRADLRMVGPAQTLRYGALREDVFEERGGGMNAQKLAIDNLVSGDVLVIEARGDLTAGTLGDLLALRAMQRGAAGVVTDGAVRDYSVIAGIGLPTYCGGRHAAVLGRRHVPLDSGLPITCGDVLVLPGDVVVGDADGVIVIPRRLVDEVALGAIEQEREEAFIAARLEAGESLDGLFPLGPESRAAYEAWRAQQDAEARADDEYDVKQHSGSEGRA